MRIPLERLKDRPSEHAFQADTAWWRRVASPARELPGALEPPLAVRLHAHRMGEDLYLEGSVAGSLELECSRCLARYRHGLHEPFRLVLEPAGGREPADPEGARALARDGMCLGEDAETGWYRETEIDLSEFVYEIVALALPVQPLCREDCAGLCSRCGAELSLGPCGCSEIEPDSPFAVLAVLREGSGKGES